MEALSPEGSGLRHEGAYLAEILTPDLCVIGAGLGGLTAATEARALGGSVVLIERDKMGGDYLNTGTVPSRALAAAAAHAHAVRTGVPFGIAADEPRIHTRKVHDAVQQVIAAIAPKEAAARIEALGATVIKAEARFLDGHTVVAGETQVRARRFVIATGARSVVPAIPGLESVPFFTSETIFDNTRKLTHLVIIGGGATCLELAQSYARLGSQVTVAAPGALLPASDPELAAVGLERMLSEGVDIRDGTQVAQVQPRSQGIGVLVRKGERDELLDASHILVANGRAPNLESLALDKAGIRRSKADPASLEVSAGLRTSNHRVYAVGAAAGGEQRAHISAYHARLAVRNALLGLPVHADAPSIPSVAFTDPEIAEVGLTEPEARKRLGDGFQVLRASFADNDRARATRQAYGVVKLVVARNGRILGAGIAGDRAGELIALFSLAISRRMSVGDLANVPVPNATLAESIGRLTAEYFRGRAIDPLVERMVALVRLLP
jgi:pyruvate/2-oxoglutarate dehydrogenase complex dihydrolipoamide dehydrogenase (E3) component